MSLDEQSESYARRVGEIWSGRGSAVRSWWQSAAAVREVHRRITGDPTITPPRYFKEHYCRRPLGAAISLGAGGGQLEQEMLALDVCASIVGVDISPARVEGANRAVPAELRDRLRFECHNLERWRPAGQVDLVVARDALHHVARLEELSAAIEDVLNPGGLIYCDEFVGPARFQWTDRQLAIINRLLDRLSAELGADLVADDGSRRRAVTRPAIAALTALDPSEAIRSDEIPAVMCAHFDLVERRPYGGALFHQFFNRIMGNFDGHDDLVRVVMEFDFILCDEGVLAPDYVWAVYRRRAPA
jgi:SAM-dependent methyltransferase